MRTSPRFAARALPQRLPVRPGRRGTAPSPGTAGLQRRVAHLLGTVELEPQDLPAAAVLVVRRLGDPLPGRFLPGPAALRVGPAWEGASRAALAALRRSAARPALGPVPPDAPAVLFADRAELLVCLARDLLRGEGGRWWWRAVLRTLPDGPLPALAAALEGEAAFVPAVLARLAATGDALTVVSALSRATAARILSAPRLIARSSFKS